MIPSRNHVISTFSLCHPQPVHAWSQDGCENENIHSAIHVAIRLSSLFLSMSKENFLRDSAADFPSHLIGVSPNHSFGKKDETTMTGLNQSSVKALWLGRSPTVLKVHLSKVNRIRMLLPGRWHYVVAKSAFHSPPMVYSSYPCSVHKPHLTGHGSLLDLVLGGHWRSFSWWSGDREQRRKGRGCKDKSRNLNPLGHRGIGSTPSH